jgi:hypothetical protein
MVAVLAFIYPVCARQAPPEEVRRIKHWISGLGDEDDSKRTEAKARLSDALEESPAGPVAALLRHANVVAARQLVRTECRELLITRQRTKREAARKIAADKLDLPLRRIIDIPYLPYVLDEVFLFAIFNPASRMAGPTAKTYVSISFATAVATPVIRRHEDGIAPEGLSRLLAACDFGVESAEDALDVAVLTAGLASTGNADGWCLIPQPDTVAPCDRWPAGSKLPRNLQQKALKLTVTPTADENAYVVNFTTWAAVGGRVSNWRIRVNSDRVITVEHHEIIGGAFGIGFS